MREIIVKSLLKHGKMTINVDSLEARRILEELRSEGLVRRVKYVSPWHNGYAITRKGQEKLGQGGS